MCAMLTSTESKVMGAVQIDSGVPNLTMHAKECECSLM